MTNIKPKVFVASSVEGLDVSYALQENLEHSAEVTVWSQGIFDLSEYVLDELVKGLCEFDFSVFVFSFDDVTRIRSEESKTTRDNVVFELGLFIGSLGRQRCYIVMPRGIKKIHLPTDILGITPATYDPDRIDSNPQAALGTACNQIRRMLKKHGLRDTNKLNYSPSISKQASDAGLTAFYQSRDDYGKYRKDASSIDRYVSTAKHSIHMVSINLMTGLPFDDLCAAVKEKLEGGNESFEFQISLLNPWNVNLMGALAPVLNVKSGKLSQSIMDSLEALLDAKSKLSEDAQRRFTIKVHDAIPFGSAIMLDAFHDEGRIQIETKSYKTPVRKSFAFEITNNAESEIFLTLRDGYGLLLDEALEYEKILESLG